jgi:hypothetical protein
MERYEMERFEREGVNRLIMQFLQRHKRYELVRAWSFDYGRYSAH